MKLSVAFLSLAVLGLNLFVQAAPLPATRSNGLSVNGDDHLTRRAEKHEDTNTPTTAHVDNGGHESPTPSSKSPESPGSDFSELTVTHFSPTITPPAAPDAATGGEGGKEKPIMVMTPSEKKIPFGQRPDPGSMLLFDPKTGGHTRPNSPARRGHKTPRGHSGPNTPGRNTPHGSRSTTPNPNSRLDTTALVTRVSQEVNEAQAANKAEAAGKR